MAAWGTSWHSPLALWLDSGIHFHLPKPLCAYVLALGWVGFNILQPALRQLDNMNAKASGAAPRSGCCPEVHPYQLLKGSILAGEEVDDYGW